MKCRNFCLLAGLAVAGCATAVTPDSSSAPATQAANPDAGDPAPDYGSGSGDDGTGTTGDDAGTTTQDSGTTPQDGGKTTQDSGNPPPPPPPPPTTPMPSAGEIAISEVMYNPSGSEPDEEWIEITNLASAARSLSGLTLTDGSGSTHTIASSPAVVIQPGAYVVLARNKATATSAGVPAAAIVYQYASITLANGSTGGITIKNGTTTLASVPFGQWTAALNGESISLKNMTAPGTAGSWCFSPSEWGTATDYGTPGAASDCP